MSNPCPVVHFEMSHDDYARMAKFYETVFHWRMKELGEEMGNYVLAETTETDPATQRPTTPGAINGGFAPRRFGDNPPSVVIAVEDIRASMKAVEDCGGKVLGGMTPGEPDNIPGVGLYAAIEDTEGNRVGMLQPSM